MAHAIKDCLTGTRYSHPSPKGHPSFGMTGDINDDCILIEKDRSNRFRFKLMLPTNAPDPSKDAPIQAKVVLRGVQGPYLGESNCGQMLIVLRNDITEFNNTISHEIGHALNQTPKPGMQPKGLSVHPHQYTKHGGIGSHCNAVDKGGKHQKGTLKKDVYPSRICVMFHEGDSKCINRFCDVCIPYVKATNANEFGV